MKAFFFILWTYTSCAFGQIFHDPVSSEALYEQLLSEGEPPREVGYPPITADQAEFAVNPSYDSYYDPSLKHLELQIKRQAETERNGEVVTDPFGGDVEGRKASNPKKAMVAPLSQALSGNMEQERMNDIYFVTIVSVGTAMAVFAIVGAGFCYHRVQKNSHAGEDVDYPAYGVTGPGKEVSPTSGDRKLAQSAQMYHYQHQKQQMIAFDRNSGSQRAGNGNGGISNGGNSDAESDDGEEGDYTVYECPGLAPTGEMEVRNPLFQDDPTPKANP